MKRTHLVCCEPECRECVLPGDGHAPELDARVAEYAAVCALVTFFGDEGEV